VERENVEQGFCQRKEPNKINKIGTFFRTQVDKWIPAAICQRNLKNCWSNSDGIAFHPRGTVML